MGVIPVACEFPGQVCRIFRTPLAAQVVAGVHSDAVQPARHGLLSAHFVQVAVELQENFLRHVLRVGQVSHQPQRGHQHEAFILAHQGIKRREIAGARRLPQVRRFVPLRPVCRCHQCLAAHAFH